MTPKNMIEFAPTVENDERKTPWDRKVQSTYEDQIFKPEFGNRQLNFETGLNWIRVVPALMGSNHWMLHIPAIAMKHGRFAHPRTYQKSAESVFDRAYRWFAAHASEKLYNRANPSGYRLLCDSLCACWCLRENKAGGVDARLFLGSSFDGAGNRPAGPGYRIWQALTQPDPDVDVVDEPLHPNRGTMICIEKSLPAGTRYPRYEVRAGRRAAPIQELLDRMEPAEFNALCPIENTIRELSEQEQWDHLARVVGADVAAEIRSADV